MFKVSIKRKRRTPIKPLAKKPNQIKVGFPLGKVGNNVLDHAIWNHFGTETIPERPFLANAIRDNADVYRAGMRKSAPKLLRGQTSMLTVLSKLGILAQGHIQSEITNLASPPNAPSTVAQKGSSNPLIDTGEMRGAVTWKIND